MNINTDPDFVTCVDFLDQLMVDGKMRFDGPDAEAKVEQLKVALAASERLILTPQADTDFLTMMVCIEMNNIAQQVIATIDPFAGLMSKLVDLARRTGVDLTDIPGLAPESSSVPERYGMYL